jgi:hypothetical protein
MSLGGAFGVGRHSPSLGLAQAHPDKDRFVLDVDRRD